MTFTKTTKIDKNWKPTFQNESPVVEKERSNVLKFTWKAAKVAEIKSFFVWLDCGNVACVRISDVSSCGVWCNIVSQVFRLIIRWVRIGILEAGVGEIITFVIFYQRILFRHYLLNNICNLRWHCVSPGNKKILPKS